MNTKKTVDAIVRDTLKKLGINNTIKSKKVINELIHNLLYVDKVARIDTYIVSNSLTLNTIHILGIVKDFEIHGSDSALEYIRVNTILPDTHSFNIVKILNSL